MSISAKRTHLFTGHSGAIYALENGFGPQFLLSGGSDRVIAAWNLEQSGDPLPLAQLPAPVYSLCFLPDQQVLLAGTGAGSIHVIDGVAKKEIKILQLHTAQVFDLRHSAKHGLFFSAGGDGQLAVGNSNTFELARIKKLCNEKVRGLALHPDEQELAVACGDGSIRIFSLPGMEEVFTIAAHQQSANCVAYHPAGKYLLSGGKDAHLRAWRTDSRELITEIPAHNFAIYSIVFSPDAMYFATGSRDKTVKIWNAETPGFLLRISKENQDGHINSVNRLLWNKQQGVLFSAGDDRSVMGWQIG